MKRLLDVAASTIGLLLAWPLLLTIAIVIRLESPGPAIFRQIRIGKDRREFTCYKLRTMRTGTGDVPTHCVPASSVTALGIYLRRFKIDELPQLYNVLSGDMSLVGPRPCLPSQVELVEARQRLGVFRVRPGVTGLAQVQGIDMSDACQLANVDAEYVRTQSFITDCMIIWATIRGEGIGVDRIVRP